MIFDRNIAFDTYHSFLPTLLLIYALEPKSNPKPKRIFFLNRNQNLIFIRFNRNLNKTIFLNRNRNTNLPNFKVPTPG